MPLDYEKIKNWPFKPVMRRYTRADVVRFARGFGAGLPGTLQQDDVRFLDPSGAVAMPMAAVALADGEFWQRDPEAGLSWQQMVHAAEAITMHRPLPAEGSVVVTRRNVEVYDRGVDKGAVVWEQQHLSDISGELLVTIDVTSVLRADGGFGGAAEGAPTPKRVPADRDPDLVLEVATPTCERPVFQLAVDLDIATSIPNARPGQRMLRGVGSFGLAGRAVLKLLCDNEPRRLRHLGVRYAGPMLTDETMRIEVWRTGTGSAAFRMHAVERDVPVLNHCHVQFDA
jgi:hypothetical protein